MEQHKIIENEHIFENYDRYLTITKLTNGELIRYGSMLYEKKNSQEWSNWLESIVEKIDTMSRDESNLILNKVKTYYEKLIMEFEQIYDYMENEQDEIGKSVKSMIEQKENEIKYNNIMEIEINEVGRMVKMLLDEIEK